MTGETRFLRACRRQAVDCTPVWFMRQAGRALPEYRALKERHSFLELARDPEKIVEITLMPLRRMAVDAAIIFADIMLPLTAMGAAFSIVEGVGPVVESPIRSHAQVDALRRFDPREDLSFVLEAIAEVRRRIAGDRALIGFAGAPFTLACYMIEGRPSRDFSRAKAWMYQEPRGWHRLMDILADVQLNYLRAQIEAGAQAVQLFDSWAGGLGPDDYDEYVLPYSRRILRGIEETGVPSIHFGTGTATILPSMAQAGGEVIGLDWRIPIDQGWALVGEDRAVQGNLDPSTLLGPFSKVEARAGAILRKVAGRPGHIFNLGHGVLPDTPLEHLQGLVDWVHEQRIV